MSLDLLFGCPKAQVRATHIFILINDLMIDCRVHKFVDDTTLTETLSVIGVVRRRRRKRFRRPGVPGDRQ